MKTFSTLIAGIMVLCLSCGKTANNSTANEDPDVGIVKEYYPDKTIKTEISVKGNLRHGITKNYDSRGRLLSEVNYENNVRQGIAKNYYAETGTVSTIIEYKDGIKIGNEYYYYESGKEYRVTPYDSGKRNGIQKLYYEDGKLLAEVPFKDDYAGEGLKEYNEDGTLKDNYPEIVIKKEDYLKTANKILLRISLSNKSDNVKFYRGKLKDGYLHKECRLMASQDGVVQIDYNIPNGAVLRQTIYICCNYKTRYGNPYVMAKTYYLEVINN